jgi:hypothetical protein
MVCNVCRVFDRNVYEKKKREGGSQYGHSLWSIEHMHMILMIESILPSTLHIYASPAASGYWPLQTVGFILLHKPLKLYRSH